MGLEVANYYQEEGYKSLNGFTKKDIDNLIVDLKVQGREHEIQRSISALKNTKRTNVPKQLAYERYGWYCEKYWRYSKYYWYHKADI